MNVNDLLTEKQKLEKEKRVLILEKEIKSLEKEIKYSNLYNIKKILKKRIKITLKTLQYLVPYIIVIGISTGIFSIMGGTPFYLDKRKKNLKIMNEYDSFGNVRYVQQYDEFEDAVNKIIVYNKWQKLEEGIYSRNIEVYSLKNIIIENIENLINDELGIINNIIKENSVKRTEFRNNISDEELEKDSYIQAIVYSELEDNYIIVKEKASENVLYTLLYVVLTILTEIVLYSFKLNNSNQKYHYQIDNIKKEYSSINHKQLIRKLEIKKENYERLTRG